MVCQVSLFVRRGTLQRAYEECLHQQMAAESLSSERQMLVMDEANANLQEEVLEPRLVGVLGATRSYYVVLLIFWPECPVQMVEHMMGAWFRQRQVPATREYPGFAARGSALSTRPYKSRFPAVSWWMDLPVSGLSAACQLR